MAYNLSGNAGVAGATVSWSGTTSGSTVADASGNYNAVGVLTSGGTYSITASLALYTFSPSSYYYPGVTQDLDYNFTATPVPLAQILQKVSQINTTGGDTVSVTFPSAIQSTSGLIVAVMAVDTGAAIATDSYGTGGTAPGYASVTDSLGNSLAPGGASVAIWGDQTHGTTLFCGIYTQLNAGFVTGGSDTVTFTFTPLSSAGNCVVGIVAYEVESFAPGGDTANTNIAGENDSPGCYPITFPMTVNGNITLGGASNPYGLFAITCAVATTTDGSIFNVGSEQATNPYTQPPVVGEMGWSLDASAAAIVNGVDVALAVQEEFCTGEAMNNPCRFGNTPTTAHGIAGASVAYGFELLNIYANATYSVSGSAGVPNATVSYTGTASGSVTANSSGNYNLVALPLGSYTITPTLAAYGFSPTSQSVTVSAGNVPRINFTAAGQSAPKAQPLEAFSQGNYSVVDNGAPSASVTANNPLIQSIQFNNATAASCAFTSPNTAGNLLIAAFRGNVSGTSVVTDSNGNKWTLASSQVTTAGISATQIWYAVNCAGGANTVSVTKSESQLVIAEYSGVQTSALAQTNSASAYSTTYSVPVTIQTPYALLIGAVANDTAGNRVDVPSGGFIDERNAGANVFLADQIVNLPGTYTYGGTIPGENVKWAACVAVFLPQASNSWTGDRFAAVNGAVASNGSTNTFGNETVADFVVKQKVITTNPRVAFSNPS